MKKSLSLLLVLWAYPVYGQNTILIPESRPSTPQAGWCKFEKPVAVKLADGKKHTVINCGLGTINGYDWTEMQLSYGEACSLMVFAANEGHNPAPSRATLEREKQAYNFYLVPVSTVASLSIGEFKRQGLRSATVAYRDQKRKPLNAYLDRRMSSWTFGGDEDLGDFGKGRFSESLDFGKVAEVVFPEVPETKIQVKSQVTATIAQVGGAKHALTDVRVKDGKFEFRKGETRLEIPIDKIDRIDVLRDAFPGYVCKVKLKSGAEQELEMYSYKFCGKGPDSYEVLETYSIKSIEFGTSDADSKKP